MNNPQWESNPQSERNPPSQMLTWLYWRHTLSNTFNNSSPFMAKDAGESPLWVVTVQGIGIGMAHTSSHNLCTD